MFSTSIATVSLSGTLEEKLQAIAAAGFSGVEIFENDFLAYPGTPRDLRHLAGDLGLDIVCYQPFRDFEGLPEPLRTRALERARRKFALVQELGTDLLLVCSSASPQAHGGIVRAADDLRELGDIAAAMGVRVGFEALAWGRHISDYRDAWEVVRRADHPSVGLILDSFHTLARDLPVEPIAAIPGERIFLVQLSDAPKLSLDILSWSRHFRCFPGQGGLDLAAFTRAVAATGYDGPLSLEIFNDQFRAGSAGRVATDGLRSLIQLADHVAPSLYPVPETIDRLPPATPCHGVAFIEFAVDEATAGALRRLFSGMGFAKAGQHRSKAVERWVQREINLIVNTEGKGFAHAHSITHGPGVCALGLNVEDATVAMARAERLKAVSFHQPVGPGELDIPAIRGVGGSLIYFVEPKSGTEAVWQHDFVALVADPPAGHLTRIDHIAQSMHYDEMLSWLLFYTAIFDFERHGWQDIADPGGLTQSLAVEAADGATRIVLNGSLASRTQSARFLSEFFGSGVQHMAFACDDIFATVGAMRAAGVGLLDIPDNYYDELAARYDLAPGLLARLRDNRILYDRDGEAEFFQVFTHVFAERFFFEIVERRGYGGYGAVNAAIRLMAQAREARPVEMPR
jgi:4-hydroxyphenylpyruvate dioxygenase